jgi:uncharacterized phage infection (PIP) family protein YhgE
MSTSNFESKLEDFYEVRKRSHLQQQLDDAAARMRDTLLISALHRGLFDESNEPTAELQDQIGDLQSSVANNEFDQVESEISEILDELSSDLDSVRSTFRTERHELVERVTGFRSLNDRIERVEAERIDQLLQDIQTAEDAVEALDGDIEEQLTEAEEIGADISSGVASVEDDLFEPFRGSDIEEIVKSLIQGNAVTLDDCDPETLSSLRNSELSEYVNLALEGEE